jgi:hypothetical protein
VFYSRSVGFGIKFWNNFPLQTWFRRIYQSTRVFSSGSLRWNQSSVYRTVIVSPRKGRIWGRCMYLTAYSGLILNATGLYYARDRFRFLPGQWLTNYSAFVAFHIQWRQTPRKSKTIPVTGLGGLQGSEIFRIPNCLDNRLTHCGKVVSRTHPAHFTPQKHYYFYVSGANFC